MGGWVWLGGNPIHSKPACPDLQAHNIKTCRGHNSWITGRSVLTTTGQEQEWRELEGASQVLAVPKASDPITVRSHRTAHNVQAPINKA